MTCLADATLCDEISPSIRTTRRTLPNGPHWNPMAEVKKRTYAMVPSRRDSDQSQLKKGLPPPLGPPFVDQLMMLLAHVGALCTQLCQQFLEQLFRSDRRRAARDWMPPASKQRSSGNGHNCSVV